MPLSTSSCIRNRNTDATRRFAHQLFALDTKTLTSPAVDLSQVSYGCRSISLILLIRSVPVVHRLGLRRIISVQYLGCRIEDARATLLTHHTLPSKRLFIWGRLGRCVTLDRA